MKRKILNISIILIAILSLGISGCYKTEVAPVIEPGGYGYTTATFTTDFTGTEVSEGDTITYVIKLSKPVDFDLTFSVNFSGNPDDISYEDAVIPAYGDSAVMQIVVVADDIPELDQDVTLEVGDFDLGTKYQLVNTTNPVLNLKLKNVNDPGGLTIAMSWPDDNDDWDGYVIDEAGNGDPNGWGYDYAGYAGATGADPEIMLFLEDFYGYWTADDGVYYLDVDPYDVAASTTDFTMSVGYPDGTVEFFNFTFDMAKANAGDYPMVWAYSTLKIEKTGLTYDVSLLPEYTSSKSTLSPMKRRGNYNSISRAHNNSIKIVKK